MMRARAFLNPCREQKLGNPASWHRRWNHWPKRWSS